jgi:hypothetical protein
MDMPSPLLSNDVLGRAAALLTVVCRDMRRHQKTQVPT